MTGPLDARHVPHRPEPTLAAAAAEFPHPLLALVAGMLVFQWAAMPWLFALAITCGVVLFAVAAFLEWQHERIGE